MKIKQKKSIGLIISVLLMILFSLAAAGVVIFLTQNIYSFNFEAEQLQAKYLAYSGIYYSLYDYSESSLKQNSGRYNFSDKTWFDWGWEDRIYFLKVYSVGYSERAGVIREEEKKIRIAKSAGPSWEDREYPAWNSEAAYRQGQRVFHREAVFEPKWSIAGWREPGNPRFRVWQEITDQWRDFNVYHQGDRVWHNNQQYSARVWYTRNDEPGLSGAWELVDE